MPLVRLVYRENIVQLLVQMLQQEQTRQLAELRGVRGSKSQNTSGLLQADLLECETSSQIVYTHQKKNPN